MPIHVKLEKFEGPLGLLLELIEKEELDISEIALSRVTDQYLEFIRGIDVPMHSLADFLVVASRLLLIKSRVLLPSLKLSEKEEQEIRDLESALREYQRYKEAAHHIKKLAASHKIIITRELWQGVQGNFIPPKGITPKLLEKSLSEVIEDLSRFLQPLDQKIIKRVVSIELKIKQILNRIEKKATLTLRELSNPKEKLDIILAFLAILFLFREKLVNISQDATFGEIVVKMQDKSRIPKGEFQNN